MNTDKNGVVVESKRPSWLLEYPRIVLDEEGTYFMKGVQFEHGDQAIRISNKEIWDALKVMFPGRDVNKGIYE